MNYLIMNTNLKWLAMCAFIGSAFGTFGASSQGCLYFQQDLVSCPEPEGPNYTFKFFEQESTWYVSAPHGTLLISSSVEESVQVQVRTMYSKGGLLVSDNRGEFGGKLCCIPYRGDPYVIDDVNVKQLIKWNERIYVLGCKYAQRLGTFGALESEGPRQRYVIKKISSFEGEPVMMAVVSNATALLVTAKGLFRINQQGKLTMFHSGGAYWQGMRLTSAVVLPDNVVVIGMTKYIVRLKCDAEYTKVEDVAWFEIKRKKEAPK